MPIEFKKYDTIPDINKPGVYLFDNAEQYFFRKVKVSKFTNLIRESLGTFEIYARSNKQLVLPEVGNTDYNNLLIVQPPIYEDPYWAGKRGYDPEEDTIGNVLFDNNQVISRKLIDDHFGLINFSAESIDFTFTKENYIAQVNQNQLTPFFYYDVDIETQQYLNTSAPVKVYIGLDTWNDGLNPNNYTPPTGDEPLPQFEQMQNANLLDSVTLDSPSNESYIVKGGYGNEDGNDELGSASTTWQNTVYTEWCLSYVNVRNIGNYNIEQRETVPPIAIGYDDRPDISLVRTRSIPGSLFVNPPGWGVLNAYYIARVPPVQFKIEFEIPITKPIKVLDRIRLVDGWDHEYTVIDIRGNSQGIETIWLDILHAGAQSANSFANLEVEPGDGRSLTLNGDDHWGAGITNKIAPIPPPFELANSPNQATNLIDVGNNEPDLLEAFSDNATDTVVGSRSQFFHPDRANTQIRRPITTNSDFTQLNFLTDNIEVIDNNTTVELFPYIIPRSPRILSDWYTDYDPGQGWYLFGNTDEAWDSDGLIKSSLGDVSFGTARNVTLQMEHGQYDKNQDGTGPDGGGTFTGNVSQHLVGVPSDDAKCRLPVLQGADINGNVGPMVILHTDSEFYFHQKDTEIELDDPTAFYRIRVKCHIRRVGGLSNSSYDNTFFQIGIGFLDKCIDNDQDVRVFTNTEKMYTNPETNEDINLYSNVFTSISWPGECKGKFYIYLNTTGLHQTTNRDNGIGIQVQKVIVEKLDTTNLGELIEAELDFVNTPIYKYLVLQWGDEERPLTDQEIKDSFYFSYYNEEDDVKALSVGNAKNLFKAYRDAKYIKINNDGIVENQLYSHFYKTPGLKHIKIIVFRVDYNNQFIAETKLLQSNIFINDGAALTRDFEIFGGTDYSLLPLGNTEAIIGGLSDDSDYTQNVNTLSNDNVFDNDELIIRKTANVFSRNFNNGQYGQYPGTLDIGPIRMFNKPTYRGIYDYIYGRGQQGDVYPTGQSDLLNIFDGEFEIENNVVPQLPLNSLATDIFINNNNCIVDMNPQTIEYLTIPNKAGKQDKGIIIGDYKIKKPVNSKIVRESFMKTPEIESDIEEQAF